VTGSVKFGGDTNASRTVENCGFQRSECWGKGTSFGACRFVGGQAHFSGKTSLSKCVIKDEDVELAGEIGNGELVGVEECSLEDTSCHGVSARLDKCTVVRNRTSLSKRCRLSDCSFKEGSLEVIAGGELQISSEVPERVMEGCAFENGELSVEVAELTQCQFVGASVCLAGGNLKDCQFKDGKVRVRTVLGRQVMLHACRLENTEIDVHFSQLLATMKWEETRLTRCSVVGFPIERRQLDRVTDPKCDEYCGVLFLVAYDDYSADSMSEGKMKQPDGTEVIMRQQGRTVVVPLFLMKDEANRAKVLNEVSAVDRKLRTSYSERLNWCLGGLTSDSINGVIKSFRE